MKLSLKNIDFPFLFFLLFITQGSFPLKIVGILWAITLGINALRHFHSFNQFYFFMILYHIIYGILYIFFESFRYTPTFILTLIFWVFSFISLSQISYFIKKNSLVKVVRTIDLFFVINILFVFFQYLYITYMYDSLNPYSVSTSAGDFIRSIYSNSSVNSIIMSFFSIMYFMRKKWQKGILALIALIMSTYMSGIVIFVGSIAFGLFLFSKVKIKYKILVIISGLIFVSLFNKVSPDNVTYVERYVNRVIKNDNNTPYKIKSIYETIEYSTSSLRSFIFGSGGGNFSSRSAFISSGDYVSWYPQSLLYVSEEFDRYHLGIWTHDFKNIWDNRNNTANQPFSFYNQIVGEYGLIGVIAFLLFYLGYIVKNRKKLIYSKFMVICLLGYFVLDYWFEYFSVIIIFELLLLLDLKLNSKVGTSTQTKTLLN